MIIENIDDKIQELDQIKNQMQVVDSETFKNRFEEIEKLLIKNVSANLKSDI